MALYQISAECPHCGALNATMSRSKNHVDVRVDCPTCGRSAVLEEPRLLPDEASRRLQAYAVERADRIVGKQHDLWMLSVYFFFLLVAFFHFHDNKLVFLVGMLVFIHWTGNVDRITRTQLGYVLRLLRHSLPTLDSSAVMEKASSGSDVIASYRMSRGIAGHGLEAKPEYRYDAHVLWLKDELTLMGCSKRVIEKETDNLRNLIPVVEAACEHEGASIYSDLSGPNKAPPMKKPE